MPRFRHPARFTPLILFAAAIPAWAALPRAGAQYHITQDNKPVGTAKYSITPVRGGYTLSSSGTLQLTNFHYSFESTATIDENQNLVRDRLTGTVHGQKASADNIRFDTDADRSGKAFRLLINADGKLTNSTVDRHRNAVLVPDLDPAAYTLMAAVALRQPSTAWVLIPKENGILVPADYSPREDTRGTLEGRAVTVKHTVVAIGANNSLVLELFYTPAGALLEADLDSQGLRVTQNGFLFPAHPETAKPPQDEAAPEDSTQPE